MGQLLEIPDDVYRALQAAARDEGTTPLGWIATHLPAELGEAGSQSTYAPELGRPVCRPGRRYPERRQRTPLRAVRRPRYRLPRAQAKHRVLVTLCDTGPLGADRPRRPQPHSLCGGAFGIAPAAAAHHLAVPHRGDAPADESGRLSRPGSALGLPCRRFANPAHPERPRVEANAHADGALQRHADGCR